MLISHLQYISKLFFVNGFKQEGDNQRVDKPDLAAILKTISEPF